MTPIILGKFEAKCFALQHYCREGRKQNAEDLVLRIFHRVTFHRLFVVMHYFVLHKALVMRNIAVEFLSIYLSI